MRIIALDIHQAWAEAVVLDDSVYKRLERIGMTRDHLRKFAETLRPTDHAIVEATGNATAVLEIPAPKVDRVAVLPICSRCT
jgi:transposase